MKLTTLNYALAFLIFSLLLNCQSRAQYTIDGTDIDTNLVKTDLNVPWEMRWGPDDQLWLTERYGMVTRVDPSSGAQDTLLDLRNTVWQQSESGLLGMAFHPDFANQPWVYLVYTYQDGGNDLERLVRYEYQNNTLANPEVLLDNIDANTYHDGSRLLFLQDSTLLMTTGDAGTADQAQDMNSVSGKILRLNPDGSIPSDNPFNNKYIYSLGHRNPQGLAYNEEKDIVYISEHGPDTDDEFQILKKGRNYGWPDVEGFCDDSGEQSFCADSNVVEPLKAWTPTIAPSDLIWYNGNEFPAFQNHVFMTVLKDHMVVMMEMNEAGDTLESSQEIFTSEFGRLRDICTSPDGRIFLATNGESYRNNNPHTHDIIELTSPTPTGISGDGNQQKEAFNVFPNPAQQHIKVEVPSSWQGGRYRLTAQQGKLVRSGPIPASAFRIREKGLAPGTYILTLISDDKKSSRKVVIE